MFHFKANGFCVGWQHLGRHTHTTGSLLIWKYTVLALLALAAMVDTSLVLGWLFLSHHLPTLCSNSVLTELSWCSLSPRNIFFFCLFCRLGSAAESSVSPAPSAAIPSSTTPSAFHALQSRLVASSTPCMQAQPASALQGTCPSPSLYCEWKR